MRSENRVELIGNIGSELKLNYTGGGTAVTNFSLATNEFFKDSEGKQQKRTEWHKVTVWGKSAEACADYLKKGAPVRVVGRLKTRQWEDKEKVKRYVTEIHSNDVLFLGSAPATESSANVTPEVSEEEMQAVSLADDDSLF